MKILKRVLLVIVSLVAILLIVALFTKKSYVIEREVTINKPKAEVFDYIRHIRNQYHYNFWMMQDPAKETTSKGTDGTVGFTETWKSNDKNVGQGEQEIKAIREGEEMDIEIRFIKPFASVAQSRIITESTGAGQTKVKSVFNGSSPYPFNIMLVFMDMDDMLGKPMETTLNNLKQQLEK